MSNSVWKNIVKLLKIVLIFSASNVCNNSSICYAQDQTFTKKFGSFKSAVAFTIDPSGNFFIIDGESNELIKYSKSFKFIQKIGGYGWSSYTFDMPCDVVCMNGLDVFVADYNNHRIQRYDRNLNYVSSLKLRNAENAEKRFGYPLSVAVDRVGALYILDMENIRVVKINIFGFIEKIFGSIDAGKGRLLSPKKIRVSDSDSVFVQDGNKIIVFDIFGNYIFTIGENIFKSISSLNLYQDKLFVLEQCTLHILNYRGHHISKIFIPNCIDKELPNFYDIAVFGGKIYLLTNKEILILDVPD